jgi:transcriptional regulator with XRE-family HTH domain
MSEQITFGDWLRQRRKELGIAQEELADRVGLSFAMLRKLESGERRPSSQVAALLADYFLVSADEREAFVTFARTGRGVSTEAANAPRPTEEQVQFEISLSAARTLLGEAAWESAYADGRALTMEEAINYALVGNRAEVGMELA